MLRQALIGVIMSAWLALGAHSALAASATQISKDSQAALQSLYKKEPKAKTVGGKALAVLVFPSVVKAGLGVGGQYGDGALIKAGKTVGYYNTAGASVGLQAGAQTFGYALFFMNANALQQIDKAEGFDIGVGPTVVVVDAGVAKSLTTTTMKDDIYAFIFDQKGLMAGLGIQGNKITKISPK